MKSFSEEMRYDYPLTPDSWVVDAGAYKGNFAREITRRYDCKILGFEPLMGFWQDAIKDQSPKTLILPVALGGSNKVAVMGVANDSSGLFCESEPVELVTVLDVYCLNHLMKHTDLLKLNVEGMEYEIMERIIEKDMQWSIDNIQVQFHTNAPNYHARRMKMMEKLAESHVLTYEYPYVWENWKRR